MSSSVRSPPVALDEPDDDVSAPLLAPRPFAEHGVRLAHPGSRPGRCGTVRWRSTEDVDVLALVRQTPSSPARLVADPLLIEVSVRRCSNGRPPGRLT